MQAYGGGGGGGGSEIFWRLCSVMALDSHSWFDHVGLKVCKILKMNSYSQINPINHLK